MSKRPQPATAAPWLPSQLVTRRPADLVPDPRNARTHSRAQVAKLAALIRSHGFLVPILIDGAGQILAGHGRLLAAQLLKLDQVPCIVADHLTDAQRRAYALADNQIAQLAGWDEDQLNAELVALAGESVDLVGLGFDDERIAAALAAAGAEAPADEDGLDQLPTKRGAVHSRPGQIYELGPHRLLCGDCTNADAVGELLGGAGIDLLLTDPPYCSGGFQEAGRKAGSIGSDAVDAAGNRPRIANDTLSTRGYQALIQRVLETWPTSFIYVFTDWRMWVALFDVSERSGFGVRNMIVWDKGTPGMGRGWRTQHELVLFAAKASTDFDNHKAVGNVLAEKRTGNVLHPTQKPVEILETILDVTDFAKSVADPFCGSGSTLIAAARRDRIWYGSELDPQFCDVTRRRWTAYAKEHAISAGGGALE